MSEIHERFWEKVKTGPLAQCWPWRARRDKGGYGTFSDNESRRTVRAHRVAYEFSSGAIPSGLCVLHRCDNPSCCNPAHLFLGTHADNMRDMVAKRRNPVGARHGGAKLTEHTVREIRLRYPAERLAAIASHLGVAEATVCRVVNRKLWKHVQ